MADATDTKAIDAAEKAFAEAAASAPVETAPVAKTASAKKAPLKKKATAKKAAPKKAPAKKVVAKKAATKTKAAPKKITPKKPTAAKKPIRTTKNSKTKETTMATAKKSKAPAKNLMGDVQERAKAAFEKGGEFAGDLVEFNKANVEAMIESGKIVAEGAQGLGKDYVEEAKSAYKTLSADMKDFAALKSPTDLLQLQSKLVRRNFDAAVEFGSKNTEKMVKIANDAAAPISKRVSVATERLTKAA